MDLFNKHRTRSIEPVRYHSSSSKLYNNDWFNLQNDGKNETNETRESQVLVKPFDSHQDNSSSSSSSSLSSSSNKISLEWLPVEIIHRILTYCNSQTLLGKLGFEDEKF